MLLKINSKISKETLEKVIKLTKEFSKEISKKAEQLAEQFIEKEKEENDSERKKEKLVNILIIDLENFIFNSLRQLINSWDISLKEINEALKSGNNSVLKTETGYEILGKTLLNKYANQIVDEILRIISRAGRNLKMINNYGYISAVFFTAQERNKPFFEEVRKTLIKRLQELNRSTIVRFFYSANQKENDDYLLEGIIEEILYGDRTKLIPNLEKLPANQKKECENFLKFTPVIVVITNDRRLQARLKSKYQQKYNKLILLGLNNN